MMRTRLPLLLAAVTLAAGCGGSSATESSSSTAGSTMAAAPADSTTTTPAAGTKFAAPMLVEPTPAPGFRLKDQNGKWVSLAGLRGKAVALTFVYAHCPDTCPLIMNTLASARRKLGADASKFAIVAVSVDPKGDTPKVVRQFLSDRLLTGKASYLIGTRAQLMPVWRSYNVVARKAPTDPDAIEHSAFIYGIDRSGKIRTLYPAEPLDGKAIAHDVKLLADTRA
jgi:protein SCO1/2